ncbi:hypothetical protein [Streptomyces roseoviridis]|uniref:Septum formation-related domain-containing protein n=1 Tax=Streptomyces roseoviridis TaxID=67361 RepID=A0ABV5QX59_9ACTN
MLRPSTEFPSRDARPPRRPGVVVLPLAALVAILIVSLAVAARGGTDDGDPHATPSAPGPAGADAQARRAGAEDAAADRLSGTPDDASSGTPGLRPSAQGESASPLPEPSAKRPAPAGTDRVPGKQPAATPTASAVPPGTASPRPRPSAGRRSASAAPRTPYDTLRAGHCFDIVRDAPGTVVRRACDTPHDAELVARLRLVGSYADDRAVRDAAAALCRAPLRAKAAEQPLGTRWATFVQYPYRTSYLLGTDSVACSLAAPSDSDRKLRAPLH